MSIIRVGSNSKYAEGWDANKKHYTASLAKTLVGGTSLMLAMDDRCISPDDFAYQYISFFHPGTSADNPILIEILRTFLADIRNIIGQFLFT